ncbi:MAG: DEAD/DEAH box helicase [Candidatus Dormibacteria bacterium]
MTTFVALGVRSRTSDSLARHRIDTATPIQRDAIPPLLGGGDAVIEAPTGSGKTLAFVVPMVERLAGHRGHGARALVVTPTRELAMQVAGVIRTVDAQLRVATIIGGVGYGGQTSALRNGPDVVVACPGRLLDLAERSIARLGSIEYLVLDEADEMLDQGFARDVERIIGLCPTATSAARRQTVLASATMPAWVRALIDKHLVSPALIRSAAESAPNLEHGILRVRQADKIDVLANLLRQQRELRSQTIVFHRTKHGAKKLTRELERRGFSAAELQGNLSQNARDRAIGSFRSNHTEVLVATNVAARGIDVLNVGLVINAELPESAQWLTHRVGRTARNGAAGRAITFLSESDGEQWGKIRRQGAPTLPEIDATALLETGSWTLTAVPETAVRSPRSTARSSRWHGQRRRVNATHSPGRSRAML